MKAIKSSHGIKLMNNVHGWFKDEAALLISMLDEYQKAKNISGNIFEIGVHHGRSSIFFSHLLTKGEFLSVCDLFSNEGNVSSSGSGDESLYKANMDKFGKNKPNQIFKCFSSELTPNKISNNYRFFHIDGGHNPDEALGDLELAAATTHKEGVIIVDDPFRDEWPGVTEAILVFLQKCNEFEAIAVGFNKLFLCRKESAINYRQWMENNLSNYGFMFPYENKILPFANSQILIVFISQRYLQLNWKGRIRMLLLKLKGQ
jgi:hypothetical protein